MSLSSRRAWIEIYDLQVVKSRIESLSSRRAWIEIETVGQQFGTAYGRSPHGERGLKFLAAARPISNACRSPHGERGLKCDTEMGEHCGVKGRSPHGERGLKYNIKAHTNIAM